MNPVDHPHGGGEGKSGQGNPHPVSPWGWNTKGLKTRHNKRTDNMIVQRRRNKVRVSQMPRSTEERPVRRSAPREEGAGRLGQERSQADQDLVAPLDGHAGHGRTHDRRAQRPPAHPGAVTENMVGHKLGEFAPTRTFKAHSGDRRSRRRPEADAMQTSPPNYATRASRRRSAAWSPTSCAASPWATRSPRSSSCRRRARSSCARCSSPRRERRAATTALDIDELMSRIQVDAAPVLEALRRARQGPRHRIVKRNSHITVVVSDGKKD